jgi:peptidyl-prolyl cis-trans isomerase D
MLQQMRALSKSWVSTAFMLALALSFGIWGIADIFRGGSNDTDAVTIGSTAIPVQVFERDYRNFIRSESAQMRRQITNDEARKMGLGQIALDRVINRAALDNIVDELGLAISDADVTANIRTMGAFNGPLGTFDRTTFERVMAQQGFSEEEFIAGIRGDMKREQLLGPVEAGFQVPLGYTRALFAYFTERRAVEYVVLSPRSLETPQPPTDAELAAFVKQHEARFSTPEFRDVSYVQIGPEDVMPGLKVTDEQLHQAYDTAKSTYVVPEKRDVEQIAFRDEASAKAARTKIDAGMSFADAAKAQGTVVDNLGTVVQADLGERGAVVFALPANGVSAPLKILSGWVLMRVAKISTGISKSFDDVKEDIRKDLLKQMAQAQIVVVINKFTDTVSSGANLQEIARKTGMHFGRVPAIDAQGLAPDGSHTALPQDPDLLKQIFAADVGETGDPFALKDGRTFAINVAGVTPPKLKPLDAVRQDAIGLWLGVQSGRQLQAQAAALAGQARKDGNLTAIAQKIGAPVQSGPALSRQQTSELFSPQLIASIFREPPGGIAYGPTANRGAMVIARVTGISHPQIPANNPMIQRGFQQIASQFQEDVLLSLAKAGRDKQGVKINQKLVDQTIGGEGGS